MAMSFTKLVVDAQDRVWVGTLDGLVLRDNDGVLKRAPAWGLGAGSDLHGPVRRMVRCGSSPARLAGGEDDQLVLMHRLPGQLHMTSMLQDRHGDLWLGENQGLLRISAHGLGGAGRLNLPGGRVVSLREAPRAASGWAPAAAPPARNAVRSAPKRDGLSGDYVRTVFEDRDRQLWVGSASALDLQAAGRRFRAMPAQPRWQGTFGSQPGAGTGR